MKFSIVSLLLFSFTMPAFGWGSIGHEIIARETANLLNTTALKNCNLSKDELVLHVNDPDKIWKNQKMKHPHESRAHYFHMDEQPADWKKRKSVANMDTGFLPYRIIEYINQAKILRSKGDQSGLKERLYGIAHYLGDLTQPLHLTSDHDGQKSGLDGLHAQYETKMIHRYEQQLRTAVAAQLRTHPVNPLWSSLSHEEILFNVAEQTFHKTSELITGSRSSLVQQKSKKNRPGFQPKPRFMKDKLWSATSMLTINQLALGARLSAHIIQLICK